jgi:hypothetical protein
MLLKSRSELLKVRKKEMEGRSAMLIVSSVM